MREAVASALALYDAVKHGRWEEVKPGKSLADGFNDADSHAILDWNKRMSMLVKLSRIQQRVEERLPARKGQLSSQLTQFQKDWLERQLGKSDYYHAVRLLYFIGTAQGGAEGEAHISSAFKMISKAILNASLQQPIENTEMRIKEEAVEIVTHLAFYCGWPKAWSTFPMIQEIYGDE